MPSDIYIKSSSGTWSKMTNLFLKTGSSTWSAAKSVWLYFDAGWTRVWPLSGIYNVDSPYIANSAGSTTPRTAALRVGTTYYGKNGTWNANGWTITGYSYSWIYYDDAEGTIFSSQTPLTTYSAAVANTVSGSYDRKFVSFYIQANASNSAYNGYAESQKLAVVRNQPSNISSSLSSYTPNVGTQITYSSSWDTTAAYLSESGRTTTVWYRNSTNSTSGGTQVGTGLTYTPVAADLNNYLYVVETRFNSGTDYDLGPTTGVSVSTITTSTVATASNPPTSVSLYSMTRYDNTSVNAVISFSGGSGPYYQMYWTTGTLVPTTAAYDSASTGSPIADVFSPLTGSTYFFYIRSSTQNLGDTNIGGTATAGTYSAYSTAFASYYFESPYGATASISGSSSQGSTLTYTGNAPTASPSATQTNIVWRVNDGGPGGNSFTGGSILQTGGSTFVIPETMYGISTIGYSVRAEVTWNNGVGSQTANSSSIVITSNAPSTPTSLTATTTRTDGVNLTFSGSLGATSYDIFWNTVASSNPSASATPDFSGVSSPYLDTTISAGATRYYWVRGKNSSGTTSAWYPAATGVTGTRAQAKLPTPTGVSASDTRTDGVLITWNSVTGASYYGIWWGGPPGYDYAPDFPNIYATSYLDTGISAGSSRNYYVQAYAAGNPAGTKSDWGGGDTGTRASAPVVTAPGTPTGVGLTGSGSVSWTAVSGATSYEIQFYTASNGGGSNAAGPYSVTGISSSPYQLTSPYGGTNANWARVQVRARNSAGASSYSGWVPSASTYT